MGTTILTDDRIIAIVVAIISLLGTGFIACILWIFKRIMGEIKTYRTDSLNQRTEFHNTLNNKFKALNYYTKQTDGLLIKQEEKINIFNDHAREVKTKLIDHENKLSDHSKKLFEHDLEITNLKKTG